jgi:hypothetical protein
MDYIVHTPKPGGVIAPQNGAQIGPKTADSARNRDT